MTLVTAYFSDRYKRRGVPAAVLSLLAVIGYAIYLSKSYSIHPSYFVLIHKH